MKEISFAAAAAIATASWIFHFLFGSFDYGQEVDFARLP